MGTGRLEAGLDWVERTSADLSSDEADYLAAGQRLRDREFDRELRRLLLAAAVLLALALGSGSIAALQWNRADTATVSAVAARGSAETRRLVAEVAVAAATNRELGLLLAVEALVDTASGAEIRSIQSEG